MNTNHDPLMNLSSSDVSDSEMSSPSRKGASSNGNLDVNKYCYFQGQGVDSSTAEKIRRAVDSINKAKESLKRKKARYDKKKQQLEL